MLPTLINHHDTQILNLSADRNITFSKSDGANLYLLELLKEGSWKDINVFPLLHINSSMLMYQCGHETGHHFLDIFFYLPFLI